jgi:hypothetical protein
MGDFPFAREQMCSPPLLLGLPMWCPELLSALCALKEAAQWIGKWPVFNRKLINTLSPPEVVLLISMCNMPQRSGLELDNVLRGCLLSGVIRLLLGFWRMNPG